MCMHILFEKIIIQSFFSLLDKTYLEYMINAFEM